MMEKELKLVNAGTREERTDSIDSQAVEAKPGWRTQTLTLIGTVVVLGGGGIFMAMSVMHALDTNYPGWILVPVATVLTIVGLALVIIGRAKA